MGSRPIYRLSTDRVLTDTRSILDRVATDISTDITIEAPHKIRDPDRSVCFADMEGIFQDYGNKKIERFPVYHTVKGFDIQLRFSAEKCTGQLVEITSRDTNQFLRITLLDIGPIRMSFSTPIGKGQLNLAMPSKGGFCDGKRHSLSLSIYRGVVSYGVDKVTPVRFYVARLRAPFSSPANIIIGRGIKGCVSGSTVVNRFNWTHEYRVGISSGCSVKSKY